MKLPPLNNYSTRGNGFYSSGEVDTEQGGIELTSGAWSMELRKAKIEKRKKQLQESLKRAKERCENEGKTPCRGKRGYRDKVICCTGWCNSDLPGKNGEPICEEDYYAEKAINSISYNNSDFYRNALNYLKQ